MDWISSTASGVMGNLPVLLFLTFILMALVSAADILWATVAALGFLAVLWLGGTVLAAAGGWMVAFWAIVLLMLFYSWGRRCERGQVGEFIIQTLVVFGLTYWLVATNLNMSASATFIAVLVLTLVYLVVGIPVAIWKWRSYNKDAKEKVMKNRLDWLSSKLFTYVKHYNTGAQRQNSEENRNALKFHEALKSYANYTDAQLMGINPFPIELFDNEIDNRRFFMPEISQSKALFASWVVAWPGVLIFLLLDDLVKLVIDYVYQRLAKTLVSIQASVVGNRTDLIKPADIPAKK